MPKTQHELANQPELLRRLTDEACAVRPARDAALLQRAVDVVAGRHDATAFLHDGAMVAALRQEATQLHAEKDVVAALAWGKVAYVANRRFAHGWLSFLDIVIAAKVFEQPEYVAAKPSRPIPPHIMQYWDEPMPPSDVGELIQTWKGSTDYSHELFDDTKARAFISERFESSVLNAYHQAPHVTCKADVFRLLWLALEGGIYIDADEQKIGDLGSLLPAEAGLVLTWSLGNPPCINNWFIGARPNHPMIWSYLRLAMHHLHGARERGIKLSAWILTGPAVVSFSTLDSYCVHGMSAIADVVYHSDAHFREVSGVKHDLAYKSDPNRNWRLS